MIPFLILKQVNTHSVNFCKSHKIITSLSKNLESLRVKACPALIGFQILEIKYKSSNIGITIVIKLRTLIRQEWNAGVIECSHGEKGSKSFWWSNLWRWSASRALFVLIREFRSTDLESFSVMIDQSCRSSDNSVLVKAWTSFVPKIAVFRSIRRPQLRAKKTASGTERFLVAVLNLFGLVSF